MERLIKWLPVNIPPEDSSTLGIVHGDYKLDNMIFHPTEPRVLAVVDWELSTLGAPVPVPLCLVLWLTTLWCECRELSC